MLRGLTLVKKVRFATAGMGLRWIVAGLLAATWLIAVGGGLDDWSMTGLAAPVLTAACQSYLQPYLDWVHTNPNNYVASTLASNQSNYAVVYARANLSFLPRNPAILGSVDQFVGSAGPGDVLANFRTWTRPNDLVAHPFNPDANDQLTLTIALDGTMLITQSILGNIPFTFDCNHTQGQPADEGVIIGQSQNPWSTTILVSLV